MPWINRQNKKSGTEKISLHSLFVYDNHQVHFRPESKYMITLILIGSVAIASSLTVLLIVSYLVLGNEYVLSRVFMGVVAVLFLCCVLIFLKRGFIQLAAWMLILLYAAISSSVLWIWGINSPIGILMLCFVVLLAAVTLGSKSIIYVTVLLAFILIFIELMTILGISRPDVSKLDDASSFGDVASYVIIFSIFALIAWVSIRRTEFALKKASDAELALLKEKAQLAIRLKRRTESLRKAQLEEMKNLYRFAELGQLTTVTLHELANHLSVLALDIDSVTAEKDGRDKMKSVKESVSYIDAMIRQVREQLTITAEVKNVNVVEIINKAVESVEQKFRRSKIEINVVVPLKKNLFTKGDPARLSQVMIVLITNAVQASLELPANKRADVLVKLVLNHSNLQIYVVDHGVGIPSHMRTTLFEPKQSKKENGLGIGLFIAKQIIETHFHGKLSLEDASEGTHFLIQVPKVSSSKP